VLSGSQIQFFVDGTLRVSATDSTFASGQVGLINYRSETRYDDVRFTSGGGTLPDLVVSSLRISDNASGGCISGPSPLGLLVTVANTGASAAGSFAVTANGSPAQTVSGLAAGASTTLWFAGYQSSGPNTATVDSANQVAESNETNNTLSQQVPVPTPRPTCTATTAPPTATSSPVSPNLQETFEDNLANDFTVVTGSWSIISEGSQVYVPTVLFARSVYTGASYSNGSLEATIKVPSWSSASDRLVGLLARYQNTDNYYVFGSDGANLFINRKQGGVTTTLTSTPFTLNVNQTYTFQAELNGTQLTLLVNGTPRVSANDTAFATGQVGLINYRSETRFDNVAFTAQ
jgi:hypothetical protein